MRIDLRTIKIYLISPGTGKYEARQVAVFERLKALGCTNIEIFTSVKDEQMYNSLTLSNIAIFEKELQENRPFMIVEDDCQFLYDQYSFDIPDSTDVYYFGVSSWVYPYPYETLLKRHEQAFHIFPNLKGHHTLEGNSVRIRGMTGTGAVLFISHTFLRKFIVCAKELLDWSDRTKSTFSHDLIFATLQNEFSFYAQPSPLTYQDGSLGGQEAQTKLRYKDGRYIA